MKTLAAEIRRGTDIVVPQPTCRLRPEEGLRPTTSGGADAELVAANTYDAAEYLIDLHEGPDTALDTNFNGELSAQITYHDPCHLRAQNIGEAGRGLMKLTGA